jgi:hypothetical protein
MQDKINKNHNIIVKLNYINKDQPPVLSQIVKLIDL